VQVAAREARVSPIARLRSGVSEGCALVLLDQLEAAPTGLLGSSAWYECDRAEDRRSEHAIDGVALGPPALSAVADGTGVAVSGHGPSWIAGPVAERCPNAERCVDPFHLIQLATDALDQVRREVWNEARRAGQTDRARELKGARFALWKNPGRLTARQQAKLSDIQRTNKALYRAYLLKEQLRQIYRLPPKQAIVLLELWLQWARRCRLAPFVKLARTITEQREGILAAIPGR
jgi:hypothetical protein